MGSSGDLPTRNRTLELTVQALCVQSAPDDFSLNFFWIIDRHFNMIWWAMSVFLHCKCHRLACQYYKKSRCKSRLRSCCADWFIERGYCFQSTVEKVMIMLLDKLRFVGLFVPRLASTWAEIASDSSLKFSHPLALSIFSSCVGVVRKTYWMLPLSSYIREK